MIFSMIRKVTLLLFLPFALPAAVIPFSGTFTQDDNFQFLTFTLDSTSTVNLQTTSFTNSGGFVPYLHVWDSNGVDLSGVEPTLADAIYNMNNLIAGTYFVGLTVANNKATGDLPSPGLPTPTVFDHNGEGNFTSVQFSCGGSGPFWASDCLQYTGAWALNMSGVDSASLYPQSGSIPEPTSIALFLLGALAFNRFSRHRPSRSD